MPHVIYLTPIQPGILVRSCWGRFVMLGLQKHPRLISH